MSTENQDEKTSTVEDKLKAAVAASTTETEDKGTEKEPAEVAEEEKEKGEGEPEGKSEHRIPKKRFDEVNTKYKDAAASKDLLTQQLAESNQKLVKMAELLELKEQDVQTLNEIKSFVNDPAMADHVYAIDAKLKGIEQEVEKGESTPDEAQAKTRELLQQTRDEMADIQATASAEALVARVDVLADKLMAQLPETYNEQDRTMVQTLWTEKMDQAAWDQAVKNPDNISEQLTESFQEALNVYGTPRGALFTAEEVEELTPEKAAVKAPEEELAELMKPDWGALKTTELEGGKTKIEPEKSDAEFNAALTAVLKEANKG